MRIYIFISLAVFCHKEKQKGLILPSLKFLTYIDSTILFDFFRCIKIHNKQKYSVYVPANSTIPVRSWGLGPCHARGVSTLYLPLVSVHSTIPFFIGQKINRILKSILFSGHLLLSYNLCW